MRCPSCSADLPANARVCGRCRRSLSAPAAAASSPQDADAGDDDGFTDESTRADPRAIKAALNMMRHPTEVLTGVNRDDVEAEIRRAAAALERENALASQSAPEPATDEAADDFEGGATMVDPGLMERLTQTQQARPQPAGPPRISAPRRDASPAVPLMAAVAPPPAAAPPAPAPQAAQAAPETADDPPAPVRFPWGVAVAAAVASVLVALVGFLLVSGRLP